MGLRDKIKSLFRGDKNSQNYGREYMANPKNNTTMAAESPMKSEIITNERGRQYQKFTYKDGNTKVGQMYDTTVLTLLEAYDTPSMNPGQKIYLAKVGWDNEDWTKFVGQEEVDREEEIILEVDVKKLQTDPEYQKCLMTKLLDARKVSQLLYEQGMKREDAQLQCGIYVGNVVPDSRNGGYRPGFDRDIGRTVHNSREQEDRRIKYERKQYEKSIVAERRRAEEIKRKKEARARLDAEIEEYENGGR